MPHLKLILLKDNYRSSQNILDTSRALISKNEKRIVHNVSHLGVDKILVAKHSAFSKSKVLPQVLEYPNRLQEEVDIMAKKAIDDRRSYPATVVDAAELSYQSDEPQLTAAA